jgi:hypothetical protein
MQKRWLSVCTGRGQSQFGFFNQLLSYFRIAATDDTIREIVREIVLPEDAILVHTSGANR